MLYVKIYSSLSRVLGYAILSMSGLLYIRNIVYESGSKVTSMALTATATIAALSALCFSFVHCINDEDDKKNTIYAGEKFLHSTLLIIQTLFLKYALDQALAFESVKTIVWLKITIQIVASILLTGIGGFAVTMAAHGFNSLNKTLWIHYEKNAEQNLSKKKNTP